jgi:ornithine cyclodeaminase/alanine dehydrogenase-like protein (mu-crystallin family)
MPTQLAVIDAERTCDALPFARLIPVLRQAFAGGAKVPARHHHHMAQPDGTTAVLLLMPAWQDQGYLGVKIVTIFPGNSARGLPGLDSSYLLCDGQTGRHLALIDGNQITARRTVGVAALAASYLARQDATSLLLVGAGRVASLAAEAFRMVRPIRTVAVWNRDRAKAAKLVEALQGRGFDAVIAPSLREAAGEVDIISCATLSTEPLIQADWLKPGTHLDLIGSFTPAMREADDACLARGRVYVDSLDAGRSDPERHTDPSRHRRDSWPALRRRHCGARHRRRNHGLQGRWHRPVGYRRRRAGLPHGARRGLIVIPLPKVPERGRTTALC